MKWVDLALSGAGSFVVERLFSIATNQLKVAIAGDLLRAEKRVMGSRRSVEQANSRKGEGKH